MPASNEDPQDSESVLRTCCPPMENPMAENIFLMPSSLVRTAYCARLQELVNQSSKKTCDQTYMLSSYVTVGKYGPLYGAGYDNNGQTSESIMMSDRDIPY